MTNKKEILLKIGRKEGYDEQVILRWVKIYGLKKTKVFIDSFRNPIRRSIFVNKKKCSRLRIIDSLKQKGFFLRTSVFHRDCLIIIRQPFSPSSTPEYLSGCFLLLSETSVLPPLLLQRICSSSSNTLVDMAAAPGIKTILLSFFFPQSSIIAIERNPERMIKLRSNITRLDVRNVVCVLGDSRQLGKYGGIVDCVLLDAPCTGSGIVHKDPTRKHSRNVQDILKLASVQKQLVKAGVNILKRDGLLIYSTCSLEPEENEQVMVWALEHLPIEIVNLRDFMNDSLFSEISAPIIKVVPQQYQSSLKNCIRIDPTSSRDGFFIAALRKK